MLHYTYDQVKHLPHFPFAYSGEDDVEKSSLGGAGQIQWTIINNAHFFTMKMMISYNTLDAAGLDDGVNHLTGVLSGTEQPFFKDPIALDTIAIPGRQRTTAVAGDPGQPLHVAGLPWPLFWAAKDNVNFDLRNDIDFIQHCKLTLVGFHFPTKTFNMP